MSARDALVDALAAIEQTLDNRIVVTRVILDAHGRELYRISRGSVQRPPGSHIGEPADTGVTP